MTDTGRHRAVQDQVRRMERLEGRVTEMERTLKEFTAILKMYQLAGYGIRTIRWLAIVGSAIVGILGFIKGWGK
jgi:hypothetical protein